MASRSIVVAGCMAAALGLGFSSLAEAGVGVGLGVGAVKLRQTKSSLGELAPGYTFGPWHTPSGLVNVRFDLGDRFALQLDGSAWEYSRTDTTEYYDGSGSSRTVTQTEKTRYIRATVNVLYVKSTRRLELAIGGGGGFYGIEWFPDESLGEVDPQLKGLQKKLGIQALAEVDLKLGGALRLFLSTSFETMQTQPHIDTSHHPKMARVHVGLRFKGD